MTNQINNVGYACMNLDTYPSSFRTCRLKNLSEDLHRELIAHNLNVLEAMVDYNVLHDVKLYRVSSSLIPFASSEASVLDWKQSFQGRFEQIGQKISSAGMRISVHPGQYTIINSPRPEVVTASIRELEYHADILASLRADESCKIILHIGGMYQDKEAAIRRFVQNYHRLSSRVRDRLVIENDDKIFNLEEVLRISSMTGAPVIYDNLHHLLLPSMQKYSEYEIIEKVISTWGGKERPKMHYSQQAPGKPAGAHSSTINLEKFIADYQNTYRHFDIDIMLEVKDKNRSFKKVDACLRPSVKKLQDEWDRYRFLIMSRSHEDYLNIDKMFENRNVPSAAVFYRCVDAALEKQPSLQDELNGLEYLWGYLEQKAETKEKLSFFRKLDQLKSGQIRSEAVRKGLRKLAEKYAEGLVLSSYF